VLPQKLRYRSCAVAKQKSKAALPQKSGSPIDVLDGNALGSFAFDTRYTRICCHNYLAIGILTRLSGVPAMWEWGVTRLRKY
jgi:hypothetical protein